MDPIPETQQAWQVVQLYDKDPTRTKVVIHWHSGRRIHRKGRPRDVLSLDEIPVPKPKSGQGKDLMQSFPCRILSGAQRELSSACQSGSSGTESCVRTFSYLVLSSIFSSPRIADTR
jgi:hypothetical protein